MADGVKQQEYTQKSRPKGGIALLQPALTSPPPSPSTPTPERGAVIPPRVALLPPAPPLKGPTTSQCCYIEDQAPWIRTFGRQTIVGSRLPNNSEKEQSCRTYLSSVQNLLKSKQCGTGIKTDVGWGCYSVDACLGFSPRHRKKGGKERREQKGERERERRERERDRGLWTHEIE
jgi:hypothetical protein